MLDNYGSNKKLEAEVMGKSLGSLWKNPSLGYGREMSELPGNVMRWKPRLEQANNTRAKLPEAANCRTNMGYFVKNVMKFLKELLYVLLKIWIMMENTAFVVEKIEYKVGKKYC